MSHTIDDLSTWSLTSVWSRKVLVVLGSGSLLKEVYRWEWVCGFIAHPLHSPSALCVGRYVIFLFRPLCFL